jgi:hypothetical protein
MVQPCSNQTLILLHHPHDWGLFLWFLYWSWHSNHNCELSLPQYAHYQSCEHYSRWWPLDGKYPHGQHLTKPKQPTCPQVWSCSDCDFHHLMWWWTWPTLWPQSFTKGVKCEEEGETQAKMPIWFALIVTMTTFGLNQACCTCICSSNLDWFYIQYFKSFKTEPCQARLWFQISQTNHDLSSSVLLGFT